MAAEAFAPAKINLTLHVTGQRADGYHLLDSLVIFVDVGDRICAETADRLTLTIDGPRSAGLAADDDNLVVRAARLLDRRRGAALHLTKTLPLASGIGGGSADAAATLRLLSGLWGLPLPDLRAAATLGADVPVCLESRRRRMTGVGEVLAEAPPLPPVGLVLVNPGVGVSTPAVFRALSGKFGAPMPRDLPHWVDAPALASFLARQRNDLEAPARLIEPAIGGALAALAAHPACLLARMSGSGATCFGLFASPLAAEAAVAAIAAQNPGWWVVAAKPL